MTRRIYKFKTSRFFKCNIWPTRKITQKQKQILSKIKKKKLSPFGLQLQSKRLISVLYGNLSSSQFKKILQSATKRPGKIGDNFLSLLERRLDTVVFRMQGLFHGSITFLQSRQQILHKFICVNGIVITRPSFELNPGDIISILRHHAASSLSTIAAASRSSANEVLVASHLSGREEQASFSQLKPFFRHSKINSRNPKPLHLEINYNHFIAVFLYAPQQLFYPAQFDLNLNK
jgi:ribosomal protein S4